MSRSARGEWWRTVRYSLASWARTARLCILLAVIAILVIVLTNAAVPLHIII